MALRFDDKGKFYTDYVTKESVPVVIQTALHHIRGYVYVQEDGRLSDELNSSEIFLPVTQAIVMDQVGNKLYEAKFLAVNRSQIIWVYPEEETDPKDTYAVEELLLGQEPLVSEEIYLIDQSFPPEEVNEFLEEPLVTNKDALVEEDPESKTLTVEQKLEERD